MRHAENVLLGHLSDAEALDELAREGFLTEIGREVIPTDYVRRMVTWALERYFADGRQVAPSREAIMDTWADTLERFEFSLPDPDYEIDAVGWVIADLRANFARIKAEQLGTEFASAIGTADGPDRVEVFTEFADKFYLTAQSLISRKAEADGLQGVTDAMFRLHDRIANGQQDKGMRLGIDMLDDHIHGIHPGEIFALCSESGVGKSWMAGLCCLAEWRRGRKAVLVTLENDIEMTYDRLCCMATGIPYEMFQAGQVSDDQLRALFTLIDEMEASEHRPLITQIDTSQRTASGVVRRAQLEGADSLIIDQLSFMRPEKGSKTHQRNFQVAEIMVRLKELVNETSAASKLPVLLLVQINREGAKGAHKTGRYFKEHLAESSFVEQTVDGLYAVYQSLDMKAAQRAQAQCLKLRRAPEKSFELDWHPHIGYVRGLREINLDGFHSDD